MLVMRKAKLVDGVAYQAGDPFPQSAWSRLAKRTREALLATKFVQERRVSNPGKIVPAPAPVAGHPCPKCGKSFATPQALGGHQRGHAKRGEK